VKRFDCDAVRGGTASVAGELLAEAGQHNDAARKAERVIKIQNRLPAGDRTTYDHDLMVWSYATGDPRWWCGRPLTPKEVQTNMATAAKQPPPRTETPERWTLIEAVQVAGTCPTRLPTLYRTVRKAGEPAAVAAVEDLINKVSK
jgi:hypothetical protein